MSRYARRKDDNHGDVVGAFLACGASVAPIESGSQKVPDLLVGIFGITELVEVKDGSKIPSVSRLSDAQAKWHREWKGRKPVVVRSVDDALALVARMRGAMTMSEVAK